MTANLKPLYIVFLSIDLSSVFIMFPPLICKAKPKETTPPVKNVFYTLFFIISTLSSSSQGRSKSNLPK